MFEVKQAVIYARTATSQELGSNYAMQEQIRQGLEHALRQGYEEVAGGSSLERPMLTALTQAAKEGKFTVLIVRSLDRISRNQEQAALFFHMMKEHGITIESAVKSMESVSPDAVPQSIYPFISQAERDMLAKRTRRGGKRPSQAVTPQES